jgi:hypothetical protein
MEVFNDGVGIDHIKATCEYVHGPVDFGLRGIELAIDHQPLGQMGRDWHEEVLTKW